MNLPIVCNPPFCWGGGGVEPPTKFSKRGGLPGPQLGEGGCWKRGDNFFQEEFAIFTKKKKKEKLKSKIFNDKKSL